MRSRRRALRLLAAGLALLALHVTGVAYALMSSRGRSLAVYTRSGVIVAPDGLVTTMPDFGGARQPGVFLDNTAVSMLDRPLSAGIHRLRWIAQYRGGFVDEIGQTILAGPFQDPRSPWCGIRVRVGQALLDDGDAGPGTLAALATHEVDRRLRGRHETGIGDFVRTTSLHLYWTREGQTPGEGHDGTLHADVDLDFEDAHVSFVVLVEIALERRHLHLKPRIDTAHVETTGIFASIAAFFVDVDGMARERASEPVSEFVDSLEARLSVPPDVPLGGGRTVHLSYCKNHGIAIEPGAWASVPLEIDLVPGPIDLKPVLIKRSRDDVPATNAPFSIDIDVSGMNALLNTLWTSGVLDAALSRLRDWLETQAEWRDALAIHFEDPRLTLPPTVQVRAADPVTFSFSAEASTTITDGNATMRARVFGAAALTLQTQSNSTFAVSVKNTDLALTCEPRADVLAPCYSELIAEVRKRAAELAQPVADQLAGRIDSLVQNRDLDVDRFRVHIDHVVLTSRSDPPSAWIRADVFAGIDER